jgi:hypothetical protein
MDFGELGHPMVLAAQPVDLGTRTDQEFVIHHLQDLVVSIALAVIHLILLVPQQIVNSELSILFIISIYPLKPGITQQNVTGMGGIISSPNYPTGYDDRLDYRWIITPLPGYTLRLTFNYSFGVNDCGNDYLEVRNGMLITDPLVGSYCGTTSPPTMTTAGSLFMQFYTSASVTDNGFSVTYESGLIHKSAFKQVFAY